MLSVSTQIAPDDDLLLFARMLESVSFAGEIIIFALDRHDPGLTKLAAKYQARVIDAPIPQVIEELRTRQVKEAKGDWVLIMDFDELVTPELEAEIAEVAKLESSGVGAYRIPRRNFSLGMPLSHGGFGGDYVHRLFFRAHFRSWPPEIHSTPVYTGTTGTLTRFLEHHKDASLSQMVTKTNRYSEIEARQFFEGGLPPVTPFTLLRKTIMEFVRRYILKQGFRDGRIGIIQAIYQSYSVFISYAKLFELQHKHKTW